MTIELYLVPNNPEHTVLVSPDGVAHYQIRTAKATIFGGPRVSRIQRPADSLEESVVAEIEWRKWGTPAVVHSSLPDGTDVCMKVQDLLYRRGQFSSARYFIADDGEEYRWKMMKGIGFILTQCATDKEIARYTQGLCGTGIFRVLSFMIMEKKRRDRLGDGSTLPAHDEDPQGGEGGAESGAG